MSDCPRHLARCSSRRSCVRAQQPIGWKDAYQDTSTQKQLPLLYSWLYLVEDEAEYSPTIVSITITIIIVVIAIITIAVITTTSGYSSGGSSDSTTRRLDWTLPVHTYEKRSEPPSHGLPLPGLKYCLDCHSAGRSDRVELLRAAVLAWRTKIRWLVCVTKQIRGEPYTPNSCSMIHHWRKDVLQVGRLLVGASVGQQLPSMPTRDK